MTDARPRLIGSGTSPYVRKVRAALIEKGIDHDFEASPAWNPASPANTLNPLQKVPVLVWPGRPPMFDSRVIVQGLEISVPWPPLLPTDPEHRLQALQVEALADGISDAVGLFTQEGWRTPESRSPYWLDRQRSKIEGGLTALDAAIVEWIPRDDETPGIVPLAAGAAMGFASFWQGDIVSGLPLPGLHALMDRLDERAAWQVTRPVMPAGANFPRL